MQATVGSRNSLREYILDNRAVNGYLEYTAQIM
jgi:hypothetical protein